MRSQGWRLAAAGAAAVMFASSALAQAKSQDAPGKNQKKSAPPSASVLPSPTALALAGGSAPFAWIDDASLLPPGAMVLAVSVMRWNGAGIGETQVPIVDVAVGLTPRMQLSASVPHIVDATATGGSRGGLGTTYVSGKVGVVQDAKRGLRVAVLPTLEIFSTSVLQPGDPTASRVRWGVPVSLEFARGTRRAYGSSGYFSPGVWFAGVGVGAQAAPKIAVSASLSRAWASAGDTGSPMNMRNEVSGGASYALTPTIFIFGSLGHTLATTIENGAGSTICAGVSLLLPAR